MCVVLFTDFWNHDSSKTNSIDNRYRPIQIRCVFFLESRSYKSCLRSDCRSIHFFLAKIKFKNSSFTNLININKSAMKKKC